MSDPDLDELLSAITGVLAQPEDPIPDLKLPDRLDVAAIRRKAGLSQAAFATRIGVPVATIRNWEQGRRSPDGPARVLLALLDRNPRIVEETLAGPNR